MPLRYVPRADDEVFAAHGMDVHIVWLAASELDKGETLSLRLALHIREGCGIGRCVAVEVGRVEGAILVLQ